MRYFIVKYIMTPDGKYAEQATISPKVRRADEQYASIIIDYQDQVVIKSVVGNDVLPKEFDRFDNFFHEKYPDLIGRLRAQYEPLWKAVNAIANKVVAQQ